jgi:hypothetical protein
MILLYFVILLGVHWFADFVLQTRWQAENKSHNNVALSRHVGVYLSWLFIASLFMFGWVGVGFCHRQRRFTFCDGLLY